MGGFCSVQDVREKNRLLVSSSGWSEAQVQIRIDEKTSEILSKLRDRFPTQLTTVNWLENPPDSVPTLIRRICVDLVVGQCLVDAYGSDAKISEQGWMILGKSMAELKQLREDPVILSVDGAKITGQENICEIADIVENANKQDFISTDVVDWK